MYKNIDKKTKLNLKDLVAYQEGQVVSKTLVQNEVVSMTIFSFDKGEEISTHAAGGDAMVTVLEGKGRFTVADEVFYLEDFLQLEKEFPNFTFHLALDRPDPAADAAGVKYVAGFVHQVIYETYLKDHEAPEDIEYYMCGPGPMSKAVENMLDSLGVPMEMLHFDNFGG